MRIRNSWLGLLLLVAAGCATNPSAGDPGERITLRVLNNLTPSTPVTVFAIGESGTRRRIGYVGSAQTTSVSFPAPIGPHQYVFVASVEGAPPPTTGPSRATNSGVRQRRIDEVPASTSSAIISQPIDLPRGGVAQWDLSSNLLTPLGSNPPLIERQP